MAAHVNDESATPRAGDKLRSIVTDTIAKMLPVGVNINFPGLRLR